MFEAAGIFFFNSHFDRLTVPYHHLKKHKKSAAGTERDLSANLQIVRQLSINRQWQIIY